MRLKSKIIKSSLIFCVLGGLAIASILWHGRSPEKKGSSGMGIFLVKPAFAQEDGVTFLEQEAGISAYTNAGRTIDLVKAKSAFRTVERETDEYIIGSVPLSGYPETEDVHAYVHRDGWVVTYYIKDEPAAKILDWNNYGEDEKINGTKLETGIMLISNTVAVSMKDVKYYDFRHPDANRMMTVAEAAWSAGEETFNIKLPGDFIFYEYSYSHCNKGGAEDSYMYIDEEKVAQIETGTKYGLLSPTLFFLDVFHTIKVVAGSYTSSMGWTHRKGYPAFGAIVLVYRES